MRKGRILGVCLLLSMMLVVACAPQTAPAPTPQAAPSPGAAPAPVAKAPAKPAWQEEWDRLAATARREGTLSIAMAGIGTSIRNEVAEKLKKNFGLSLEAISGRGAQLAAKLTSERNAGIYAYDNYLGGANTLVSVLKPRGFFAPLEPAFILPELTDSEIMKKTWWQGQPYWLSKGYATAITETSDLGTAINTNLVKPGDFTSWRDLLNPKWRGKVGIADPTTAGAGGSWFTAMYHVMGEDYLKEVAATKPIIVRDDRLMMEWLAQGKLAILLSPNEETLVEFQKAGAPIQTTKPKEGTWVSSGVSGLAMFDKAPHPNAAKLFVNWILSKEGSETFAIPAGAQAVRLDVTTEHLRPEQLRKPGQPDYIKDTEEQLLKSGWYQDLGKKIFAYAAQ